MRTFKKNVCTVLCLLLAAGGAAAAAVPADSLHAIVYFRSGSSSVSDLSCRDNAARLKALITGIRLVERTDSLFIRRIRIVSGASVEGNAGFNIKLSEQRALAVRAYLQERLPLSDTMFSIYSLDEDWNGLYRLVRDSYMPFRADVLAILNDIPENGPGNRRATETYKQRLKALHNGGVWYYMLGHFMPELRRCTVVCEIERSAPAPLAGVSGREEEVPTPTECSQDAATASRQTAEPHGHTCRTSRSGERPRCRIALRSNLLYDAALIPDIGAELYLGKGWSLAGNWQYAWWHSDRRHNYWRVYGGDLNLRKYFGSRSGQMLTGHHAGIYMQMLTGDFELGGEGYLSRLSWGGGLEYGYSLPAGRRFNIDFSIGIGFFESGYERYEPKGGHYVWQETGKLRWLGPTKAGISLVWLLGRTRTTKKKMQ